MTLIEKSALLPYSCEQMFALVNDVQSYPEFLDGCKAVNLIEKTDNTITAELVLGKAGLRYAFTTRNTLTPFSQMDMHLVEGPFKSFEACWNFLELKENACKTSLSMRFDFSGGLVDMALRRLFEAVANNLVTAVCKRAEQCYGK
jgi:ribosome-associated toxin RatA of RatAB toxin-antitoxin module